MHELTAQGASIIVISSELPEVLALSDRILVMREGQMVKELSRLEASEENIMGTSKNSNFAPDSVFFTEQLCHESLTIQQSMPRLPFLAAVKNPVVWHQKRIFRGPLMKYAVHQHDPV